MAPTTPEELAAAAEAGADRALAKRDSQPRKTGEQPAIPAPQEATISKGTRWTTEVLVLIVTAAIGFATVAWSQNALSKDLVLIKEQVTKKADAAASAALIAANEKQEERVRLLEQFVAKQAAINDQNLRDHADIKSSQTKILDAVLKK